MSSWKIVWFHSWWDIMVYFFFLQVNRFSKVEDRAIFVTDRHLYKMDPTKQYKVMKTIPLYNVSVLCFTLNKGFLTWFSWTTRGSTDHKSLWGFREPMNSWNVQPVSYFIQNYNFLYGVSKASNRITKAHFVWKCRTLHSMWPFFILLRA